MKISGLCRKGHGFLLSSLFAAALLLLTAGSAAAASEEGGGGITVIPDISVLFQLANFLFLLWALNTILYKPIRKIIQRRKEKVDNFESTIEAFNQDIEEKDEAFITGQRAARAKGVKAKEALLLEAAEEEKKIIEAVNSNVQQELTEIREKIAQDIDEVRGSLQVKVDEFANDIGQKILGRAV
ncbi:MAG: ATPase [Deltaproteobacteria bacterium]|jgi:F-type H+-transporting ATPase subunit b|nr:ATPase [Deltaproteobacteria bacterium]